MLIVMDASAAPNPRKRDLPKHDSFFAQFPRVASKDCLRMQDIGSEQLYYPALREMGALGETYRNRIDNCQSKVRVGSSILTAG